MRVIGLHCEASRLRENIFLTSSLVFSKNASTSSRFQSAIGRHLFIQGIDGRHSAIRLPTIRTPEKTSIMIRPNVLREV